MRITPQDFTGIGGIAAVTAGVHLQFGAGWSLIAGGALLIGMTLISLVKR